jgi:hypothetical protein
MEIPLGRPRWLAREFLISIVTLRAFDSRISIQIPFAAHGLNLICSPSYKYRVLRHILLGISLTPLSPFFFLLIPFPFFHFSDFNVLDEHRHGSTFLYSFALLIPFTFSNSKDSFLFAS